jgi:hypothetical protein
MTRFRRSRCPEAQRNNTKQLRAELMDFRAEWRREATEIRDKISSAMLWAILLYLTLTGVLLGVMAHGFKWL